MFTSEMILGAVLTAVPILLSLAVHEFAHARTALAFGDPTAKAMGRCTLNPLAHLDPIGTLAIMLVGFGWARPVPVNPANLVPRRLGSIAVSAAGPLSNLALAALCALGLRILGATGATIDLRAGAPLAAIDVLVFVLTCTILINLTLMAFNLLPLFPLDGHHIGRELLPGARQGPYMRWQWQYGRWILLGVLFGPRLLTHVAGVLDSPLLYAVGRRLDVLGWYFGRVMVPLLEMMMSDRAWPLVAGAFAKFEGFSPFFR